MSLALERRDLAEYARMPVAGALESDSLRSVFTVLAGLGVVVVALRSLADERRRAWLVAGAILMILAVEQFFDFDDVVQRFVRSSARTGGWYGGRRVAQSLTVLGVFAGLVVAYLALRRRFRWPQPRDRILVFATVCLVSLEFIGLVSLHQSDEFLSTGVVGVSVGSWIGWCSLALIAGIAAVSHPGSVGGSGYWFPTPAGAVCWAA
jgi:hypothetical protein